LKDFTHFDNEGRSRMVDVGGKEITHRTAIAAAKVFVNRETFNLIKTGGMKKGDVLTVAQVAGIMGAKQTPNLIPMCHPVQIEGINLSLKLNDENLSVEIISEVHCEGKTGVEMEALTGVTTSLLTVYDMCKAIDKGMEIGDVYLVKKDGGKSGLYENTGNSRNKTQR